MGLGDLIVKICGIKEVVGKGSSEVEALTNAMDKLPPLFPLGSKQYFSSYEQSIMPCDFETNYETMEDEITKYEARIIYSLTRAGKKQLKALNKRSPGFRDS